jgi:hypothetical protein
MISMFLAHTRELDDPEYAALEILKGLNLENRLLKNSVGIIHCSDAFISAGVVKEIAKRLPFPLVGMNTLLNSSNLGIIDNLLLTVCTLTSQTVKFSVGLSPPIENDVDTALREAYKSALKDLGGSPSMAMAYLPICKTYPNGEDVVETFDEISEGTPLFGAFASDYSIALRTPKVIFGGEDYKDNMAILLINGEVTPRFSCYPVSNKDTIRHTAIVTDSDGALIKKVNDLPVSDYFESLGLFKDGRLLGTHTIPIFVDLHNGFPPLVRSIYTQTPEGHILLGGKAPVDTTLGIGSINIAQVQEGAERMSKLVKLSNPDFFFAYSCISRNFTLGFNYTTEMEVMQSNIQGSIPYLFAYACGELCPVIRKDGRWHNEFHNLSLISFAL